MTSFDPNVSSEHTAGSPVSPDGSSDAPPDTGLAPDGGEFYRPHPRSPSDPAHDCYGANRHAGSVNDREGDGGEIGDDLDGSSPALTPGRLIAAGVAAVAAVALALFLFTFVGAGGSPAPGPSTVGGSDPTVANPTSSTASLSGTSTASASVPDAPSATSASAGHPSFRPPVLPPHTFPSVTITGTPPRPPVTSRSATEFTPAPTANQPTLAQMLVAGNAEYFLHAVANGDLTAVCGFWESSSLSAYLAQVGVPLCAQLDPSRLAGPADRSADATFSVTDPAAVEIMRGHALIPGTAIHETGASTGGVRLRYENGLWRVVFTGSPLAVSTSPTTPPFTTVPPFFSPTTPRGAVLLPVVTSSERSSR